MHEISFTIEPCTPSNDHQVRVIVDGQDLIAQLDPSMLGIDPPDFFASEALRLSGELLFARCGCGVVGCADGTTQTSRNDSTVTWLEFCPSIPRVTALTFSRKQFDAAVASFKGNHDWETTERRAERLIANLDFIGFDVPGLTFRWVSGRLDRAKISVCFVLNSVHQVIVHAPWDHDTVESAIDAIERELTKPPNEWADVEYILPRGAEFPFPQLFGPGWRRM